MFLWRLNMEQELLGALLSVAISLSGLPPLEVSEVPPILRLSHAEMTRQICPADPLSCKGMAAIFDLEQQRILVVDTLDMKLADDNSFLVHELVHVLQFKQRGHQMYENCEESAKTEGQAYRVQNAYLKMQGRLLRFYQRLAFADCDSPERLL